MFFLGLLADLLESWGLAWWRKHKNEEVADAKNRVAADSDDVVADKLRDWTRK